MDACSLRAKMQWWYSALSRRWRVCIFCIFNPCRLKQIEHMTSFQISKWGGSIVDIFRNAEWMELNFIFPYSIDFICLGFLFRESVHTREWAHVHEGGRGRGRGSPADSKLSAEPKAGLIPTTPKSWPKSKSRGGHSTDGATQEPFSTLLNEFLFWRTRMPEPTFDGLWCQLPVVNSAFFFFFFYCSWSYLLYSPK